MYFHSLNKCYMNFDIICLKKFAYEYANTSLANVPRILSSTINVLPLISLMPFVIITITPAGV